MTTEDVLREFTALATIPRCSGHEKAAGDYITADGTSLGADNGIAVALCLAVMEDRDLPHGPLGLLFTVEEETGLIGAANPGPEMIRGSYLINLDFEEDYQICIGCAGGVLITAEGTLPVHTFNRENCSEWKLSADGLKGGHSGMDIGTSPENLYHRFASFFSELSDLKPAVTDVTGEGKINAIPTNCTVTFFIPKEGEKLLLSLYRRFEKEFNKTYSNPDSTPRISLTKTDTAKVGALTDESLKNLLDLILNLPAGVRRRNEEMGGQVSTSANPGVLKVDGLGNTHLEISLRSDQQRELD